MSVHRLTALLCLSGLLCFARKDDKASMQLVAVGYRAIPHERTSYYHTQGYSNTTCYGSGTNWGYSSSATVNCSSVVSPPESYPVTMRSVEVYNKLESSGMIYTVTCTAHWIGSGCSWLTPGDTFQAEVKGTTMWITAHKGGNMGKEIHPKFRILDIRPKP